MPTKQDIAGSIAALGLPPGLTAVLAAGCALMAAIALWLLVRRQMAARRHEAQQAARLFAVRDIASYVLGDGPVDGDYLREALRHAPVEAVLQFLRLHRGEPQAIVIAQAELAGVFDPAVQALGCGVASREIAALKQLQFARAPRFRSAVLRRVIRGPTAQLRCEALYTFVAMGSAPSEVALAVWIDGTGPDITPRHEALFHLIAERLPGVLLHLARSVTTVAFQQQLAVLAVQHDNLHQPLPAMGAAAKLRAPILPSRRRA